MRRISAVLFFIVCSFQCAVATTYYVSSSGNDGGDGSQGNPWRTIRHAVTRVAANQNHTIRISAGTFVESGPFTVPTGVNLEGAGIDQTIIKAASSFYYYPGTPGFGTDKFLINVSNSNSVDGNQSIKNFTVDGDGKKLHGGIYVCNRNNVVLENIKVQYTNFCGIWLWNLRNSAAKQVTIIDSSWGSTGWAAGALMLGGIDGLELVGLNINEGVGYGIKALGPSPNKISNMKMHDSRVSVAPAGKWNNGSAPNISIELWSVDLTNCEIYDSYVDNHISLVQTNYYPPAGQKSIRVHHNTIDILTRAGGGGYGMELSVNNAEVDHNYFIRGKYGIANWAERCKNWEIHHNVFYGIQNYYPGETLRSQKSGFENVKYYNNTIEILGPETANVISAYGGPSNNVEVKNNLIINSSSSYSWFPNKLIHLENGATMAGLQVANNLFQNLPIGNIVGTYLNNLLVDPRITKSGNRPTPYYAPVAGSPLIDAGINVGLPFEGVAPDIGAYEFSTNAPPPANKIPTVSLSAPANNANYAAGSAVTLNATASDSDGSISKVEFFNGTTKLGEDLTSPYSFSWSNVVAGRYTLSAKATDNKGGVSTSTTITINVSAPNTPPVVNITSPANNSSFQQGNVIQIAANASDANGSITKVEFYNGTTKLGEDLTNPYAFSWNNSPVGVHSITAKATDNQNGVTTSAAIKLTVVGSNSLPAVTLTSPAANTTFAAGATVTLTANASDTNGTITKVEFFNGTTKLGEDTSTPYSFAWTNVPAGTYNLQARAIDNLGAVANSNSITITVGGSNVPPTVSLSAPKHNASYPTGTVISLSATASDTNGGISKVEFYNGTVKIGEDLTSPYNFAWRNVSEGTYALTAKAVDNQNAASTSNIVQITVINSTNLLSVALTEPLDNSTFASGESISINATATSASGSITKVEFFNGDTKLGEDLTSPYNFIWTDIDPGSYVLSAKATNNVGAVGNSASIEIVIRGTGPSANAGEDIEVSLPMGSIQLNASGAAEDGSAVSYSWKQVSGPSELYFSDAGMSSPEISDLVAGLYTLELSVTDANGLVAKDQVVITVTNSDETTANIPRYFTPNDDGIQDMWVWNSPEQYSNATLTIFNQAGQVIYETVSYQNNWDGTVGGSPLQPGAYYYVIRPGDGVGDIKGAVRIIR